MNGCFVDLGNIVYKRGNYWNAIVRHKYPFTEA